MKIAIIGTGYVGLVAGTCFAESGNDVSASTPTTRKIERSERGIVPIYEPGLEELVRRNSPRAACRSRPTSTRPSAPLESSSSPSARRRAGRLAPTSRVLAVARAIGRGDERLQGHRRQEHRAGRDRATRSGAVCRGPRTQPFDVVSNPEFLKEGAAIDDFMKPDRVVIGCDADQAMRWLVARVGPGVPVTITR